MVVAMSAVESGASTWKVSRRECVRAGAALVAGGVLAAATLADEPPPSSNPFVYCLNTSTIRGQKLSIVEEVELAASVGYQAIEPWIRELQQYAESGGSLPDLKKRIADLGLTVVNGISFPAWAVDDETERARGIETFKREAELIARIGGTRLAAPPAGINRAEAPPVDLWAVAERYAAVLRAGRDIGVTAVLEFWGSSRNLYRLSEAALVAIACGDPDACLLPDIYHLYRGGSDFAGLKLLSGKSIPVMHVNDYPGDRPRGELTDGDRVHVGDGAAPTDFIFRTMAENGCRTALSLELFNANYWRQDADLVARVGLEKLRTAVERALAAPTA